MPLKYLDFSNCFGILHKFLFLLTNLVEIRIGADTPPKVRRTQKKEFVDFDDKLIGDSHSRSQGALCDLPHLTKLRYLPCIVPKTFNMPNDRYGEIVSAAEV